jgi:hypothetical protein
MVRLRKNGKVAALTPVVLRSTDSTRCELRKASSPRASQTTSSA